MASFKGRGSSIILTVSLILTTLFVDVVEGSSDYTWVNTVRIIRIVIPVVVLIAVCCGGGYCFKRRKNRARAAESQMEQAPYGNTTNYPQNPAYAPGPAYTNSSGESAMNPPLYGYNTQYTNNYSNLNGTTEDKNAQNYTPDFSAPPPSYDEVAEQKRTETQHAAIS